MWCSELQRCEITDRVTFWDEHQRATEYSEARKPFCWSITQELMTQSIATLPTTNLRNSNPDGTRRHFKSHLGQLIIRNLLKRKVYTVLPLWDPKLQGVLRHCLDGLSVKTPATEKSARTLTCLKITRGHTRSTHIYLQTRNGARASILTSVSCYTVTCSLTLYFTHQAGSDFYILLHQKNSNKTSHPF